MPSTLSKLASVATTSRPLPRGDLDDVGEVVFALGIGVADLVEQCQRLRAGDRHQAAIAEADRALVVAWQSFSSRMATSLPSFSISRP